MKNGTLPKERKPLIPNSSPAGVGNGLLVAGLVLASCVAVAFIVAFAVTKSTERATKQCGSVTVYSEEDCYEVLIVGAGTAGLSMAKKLTDDNKMSVLVLEAGDDDTAKADIVDPDQSFGLVPYKFNQYFWQGETIVQTQLANRIFRYTNGRTLGGGSTVNGLQVVRGTVEFWDFFDAASGFTGNWDATSIYERYRLMDDFENHGAFPLDATRGTGTLASQKWTSVTRPVNASADNTLLTTLFSNAFSVPICADYNIPTAINCASTKQQMQENHNLATYDRTTSFSAFMHAGILNPATYVGVAPRRLRIRVRSQVIRLLWDPANALHCVGAMYLNADTGKTVNAYASKTVVLSANIRDAQMLQIEGIGPAATLAAAGVPARAINEHVGRHWMNHAIVPLVFLRSGITGANPDTVRGNSIPGGAVFLPDPSASGSPTSRGFEIITFPFPGGFAWYALHTRPFSGGTIDIQNDDPLKFPLVDNGYLSDVRDIVSWREFIRDAVSRIIIEDPTVTLAGIGYPTTVPVPPLDLANNATLDALIRANAIQNVHHWSSSTRMSTHGGSNITGGVVDPRTRVFGVTGLRVCDTSIFPEVADANLGTPATVVGDVCADLIAQDFGLLPLTKKRSGYARHAHTFDSVSYEHVASKYTGHLRAPTRSAVLRKSRTTTHKLNQMPLMK
jgi:choline dehydrogenase